MRHSDRVRRSIWLGSAGTLLVAGMILAIASGGLVVDAVGLWMAGAGLVLATAFVFWEIGFSEDRERAREEQARARQAERAEHERRRRLGFARRRRP